MSFEYLKAAEQGSTRRNVNPSIPQWAASHPMENVWVSASAGTGKTKVLTDRVLRLLLPRASGQAGTPPHRILCLTYTTAAASEMTLRVQKRLGEWVILEDEELRGSIRETMGELPTEEMMTAARQLFAKVVDTPGGLKIMTIHAFCQSVLGRFPLEAGIAPQISLLEPVSAAEMIREALGEISLRGGHTAQIFSRLAVELTEKDLIEKVENCLKDEDQIADFFTDYPESKDQKAALRQELDAPDSNPDELLLSYCKKANETGLKKFCLALEHGTETDKKRAGVIYDWLAGNTEKRRFLFQSFRDQFLKKSDGQPYAKAATKDALAAWDGTEEFFRQSAHELMQLEDQIKAIELVDLTHQLLCLSRDVSQLYAEKKAQRGLLDYNDMIQKTLNLLQQAEKSVPWVLYKLDGGLDHLLLDEAQDTNPLQWEIISLLAEEFFEQREDGKVRTLFVVGDEKQSIYRFQGASLEDFKHKHFSLKEMAGHKQASWVDKELQVSFRSTRSVLGFVDGVFNSPLIKQDIGVEHNAVLEHISHHYDRPGKVTLWPPVKGQKRNDPETWEPPIVIRDHVSAKAELADQIAKEISGWIRQGRILPSKGRAVRPGDIMILLRNRNIYADTLIRALKKELVAVAGADRVILSHHIAVEDLISLAKFALQPKDDLSLAEILRSPFIGLEDQALEDMAYGREGTLWQSVRHKADRKIVTWLETLQRKSAVNPFSFFFEALNKPCPADQVSGMRALRGRLGEDCVDVLDEFLLSVQAYEQEHLSTLQSFLVWQEENEIEIKREFDGKEDAVRIMTVHGAKGLQAPIVILPDTLRTSGEPQKNISRLIMPRRSGAKVPLWSPRKTNDSTAYTKYLDKIAAQDSAEYKRLFYVAATRAEDELVICGAMPEKKPSDESWYFYAQEGFSALGEDVEEEDGRMVYQHHHKFIAKKSEEQSKPDDKKTISPLPAWIYMPAPQEPEPARPYRPSRPSESEPSAISPLKGVDDYRFRRGILTHTLLQFLPNLPQQARRRTGELFLNTQANDITQQIREGILEEVLRIMNDELYGELFSSAAQAEVSVSGYLPSGRLISGQIDRMLVRENDILLVDYKSNRPPPSHEKDVPQVYKNQMKAYKEALQKIYPQKIIKTALLWTYGPRLMQLNDV